MKKLVSILILTIYTLSSTGASVYLHYCCGSEQPLVVDTVPAMHEDCSLCEKPDNKKESSFCCTPDNCDTASAQNDCKSVYLSADEVTNEHIISPSEKNWISDWASQVIILHWIIDFYSLQTAITKYTSTGNNDPSPATSASLFILNCTYRI